MKQKSLPGYEQFIYLCPSYRSEYLRYLFCFVIYFRLLVHHIKEPYGQITLKYRFPWKLSIFQSGCDTALWTEVLPINKKKVGTPCNAKLNSIHNLNMHKRRIKEHINVISYTFFYLVSIHNRKFRKFKMN